MKLFLQSIVDVDADGDDLWRCVEVVSLWCDARLWSNPVTDCTRPSSSSSSSSSSWLLSLRTSSLRRLLTKLTSPVKLKFHGTDTDTDTDILVDLKSACRGARRSRRVRRWSSPTCPPTCPTRALFLARMSVRDARVYTCKPVLYAISYRVPVYKITR